MPKNVFKISLTGYLVLLLTKKLLLTKTELNLVSSPYSDQIILIRLHTLFFIFYFLLKLNRIFNGSHYTSVPFQPDCWWLYVASGIAY